MKLLLSLLMLPLMSTAGSAYCLNPNQSPMNYGSYVLSATPGWQSAQIYVWHDHALNGCEATTTGYVGAHPSFQFSLAEPVNPHDSVYFQLESACTNLILVMQDGLGLQYGWTGRSTEDWVTGNDRLNTVSVWVGTTDGQSCSSDVQLNMYHQSDGT
jgi:hypothetical protein